MTTVRCRLCNNGIDEGGHLFQHCTFFSELRKHINVWIHKTVPDSPPRNVVEWNKDLLITKHHRSIIEAIMFVWWWHIWKVRNNKLHKDEAVDIYSTFQSIVSLSFLWISNRDRKHHYEWKDWIVCPVPDG